MILTQSVPDAICPRAAEFLQTLLLTPPCGLASLCPSWSAPAPLWEVCGCWQGPHSPRAVGAAPSPQHWARPAGDGNPGDSLGLGKKISEQEQGLISVLVLLGLCHLPGVESPRNSLRLSGRSDELRLLERKMGEFFLHPQLLSLLIPFMIPRAGGVKDWDVIPAWS